MVKSPSPSATGGVAAELFPFRAWMARLRAFAPTAQFERAAALVQCATLHANIKGQGRLPLVVVVGDVRETPRR